MTAKFEKVFNTSMVPIERPMLNIYMEDGARDGTLAVCCLVANIAIPLSVFR